MGLFSRLFRSLRKSSRLQKLQKKIAPPDQSIQAMLAASLSNKAQRERAFEEFLDLCESDAIVQQVMQIEQLTRADLRKLYESLLFLGLGRWVMGHYIALSTLAYGEPLQFATRGPKVGMSQTEVAFTLLEYWEGAVPQGGLLAKLRIVDPDFETPI